MDLPILTSNGIKAKDPTTLSVQSRVDDMPFAPGMAGDVGGLGGAGLWVTLGQVADEMPAWNPLFPNWRDRKLKEFTRDEPMLASAIYSMKTRIQSLNYSLNGPPRAKKFAQDLLTSPMGGYSSLLVEAGKIVDDLMTTDNGAFVELWRPGKPDSDAKDRPVLGFAHLDSRQCWRSFDPEFPVWYVNPVTGAIHKLHRSRVLMVSDNPQPIELARNIGFCATSRALRMARIMRNTMIYRDEKVSGRFTRAIGAIKGVTQKQLTDALRATDTESEGRGFAIYKGIPFLTAPDSAEDIDILLKDLASIPDGFEFESDTNLYAYILAFCFGVDAREFWPATQSGATKADASVQNMKARGRGLGVVIETLEWVIRRCLPETVEFEYDFTDDEADLQQAQIHQLEVGTLQTLVNMGAIQGYQAFALAGAKGIIDLTVLENLQQPTTSDGNVDMQAAQQPAPDSEQPDDSNAADTQPGDEAAVQKKSQVDVKSYSDYLRSLRALTRGFWSGDLGRFDFVDGMVSAVQRHFEQAWQEVEKQYGIATDERTEDSQQHLNLAINTEIGYITGFADAIAESSKANDGALQPLLDRAELWAKGYDRTVTLAQSVIGADIKLKWVRNPEKDSCDDCLQYDGKIYYRSEWEEAGVRPKGDMLQCNGINCGCTFEPTTERKTRGKPPALIGHKHHHDEIRIPA